MCLGDFNEITIDSEKLSKSVQPRSQMRAFQNVLNECRLMDMGYV
jgi:hypothetical protein